MFAKNEGPIDRAIRMVLGVVLIASGLFLFDGLQGATAGVVVAIVGLGPILTGVSGWCPLYALLGIDTLPKEKPASTGRPTRRAAAH